ncbi:MAG: dicarboxylate/amino acid:cation symporter [Wenzhouxiangellaceae bacterium]
MSLTRLSLNAQILLALIAGIMLGALFNVLDNEWIDTYLVASLFDTIGQLFIRALQMLIVPVVLVSLVCGSSNLSDPARLGRLGGKTIVLYLFTTGVAITMALTVGIIAKPGSGIEREFEPMAEIAAAPSIGEVILNLIPTNPVEAMSSGNMLQIIIFALLLGVAITLSGEAGQAVKRVFNDLNDVVMRLVAIVMKTAPLGVFALMVNLGATTGLDVFESLLFYVFLVLGLLLVHLLVTYSLLVKIVARLNPMIFLSKMRPVMLFAFSVASSNATIPLNLRNLTQRLGVHNNVASFTIPLGATINMDGTAIMQGLATAFIAQAYGVDLSIAQYAIIVFMVIMASIGAAGVPGVGLILLANVLTQVNLPPEAIGMILGVDRILDMARTAVNVSGDAAVSLCVARSEGELDLDTYLDQDQDHLLNADEDND